MKRFIIFPTNQTEGMYGYSVIALELNDENTQALQTAVKSLDHAREFDKNITRIGYDNPTLDISLFNDAYETLEDGIYTIELSEEELEIFLPESDCRVESPELTVSTSGIKIKYPAKWTDSDVNCEFTTNDIKHLIKV